MTSVSSTQRRWRELYGCGHSQVLVTFVGDLDLPTLHAGFPGFCVLCDPERRFPGKQVTIVSIVEIPEDQWGDDDEDA